MPWIGAAIAVGGALLQSNAAGNAADTAASASNRATDTQLQMFNTQNQQQAPWRQAGSNALNLIGSGFSAPGSTNIGAAKQWAMDVYMPKILQNMADIGQPVAPGWKPDDATLTQWAQYAPDSVKSGADAGVQTGYFAKQFGANDLNANLAPNWQFALNQGIGATKNAANLQTGLLSGNTLKGVADYTLNKSGDLYQQAFNNYNANQSNIFNRLSTVAGFGSAANQQSAGLAGSLAPNIASSQIGAGAAQAAGTVGAANAFAGGANNALGWYQASKLIGPQSGANSTTNLAE